MLHITDGKEENKNEIDQFKSYDNSIFAYFFGGDLQVVYGDPLKFVCKQNLLYQKPSESCMITI